jgi:hypothetical protein
MEAPIPITISLPYDTYASLLAQGLLGSYLCEAICPKYPHDCPQQGLVATLELTNSTVDRPVFFLEKDAYGINVIVERIVKIALARCPACGGRCRVLPADILAHKRYALPVIELAVRLYNQGDLSLREVAWDALYGDRTPAYTTLHGWTEGLGAYFLSRPMGQVAAGLPATRLVSELEMRFWQIKSLRQMALEIDPRRYRSKGRKERLSACKRLLLCCEVLDAKDAWKLAELNRLILSWGNSCGILFKTGILCTAIAQANSKDVVRRSENPRKEALLCPIHGRSPPGDSR